MKRETPTFIDSVGLDTAPLDFSWKGSLAHIGPIEGSPLHKRFSVLTFLGGQSVALCAYQWAIARLKAHVDASVDQEFCEGVFAWQVSKLYLRTDFSSLERKGSPASEALTDLASLTTSTVKDRWIDFPFPVPTHFANIVFLSRHLMPTSQRKDFEKWMERAFDRAEDIASRPKAPLPKIREFNNDKAAYAVASRPYLGKAIPPQAFNPDREKDGTAIEDLLEEFLGGLNWASNRFLRSPDEMTQAGFTGTPYRYRA
jgi:hypothetical protein